jgi:septal ring factor EnvC (AmiA/AmiB activator)
MAPPCVFDQFITYGVKWCEMRLAEVSAELQRKQQWVAEYNQRLNQAQMRIADLEAWYIELSSQRDSAAAQLQTAEAELAALRAISPPACKQAAASNDSGSERSC